MNGGEGRIRTYGLGYPDSSFRESRFDSATLAPLRLNNKLCLSKEVEKKADLNAVTVLTKGLAGCLCLPPVRST